MAVLPAFQGAAAARWRAGGKRVRDSECGAGTGTGLRLRVGRGELGLGRWAFLAGHGLHRAVAGPADSGRAVPCQPTGLSSGPGTACSLGLGQLGPACHWAVPCSCRAKKAGFVPCRRASGCMASYTLVRPGWLIINK